MIILFILRLVIFTGTSWVLATTPTALGLGIILYSLFFISRVRCVIDSWWAYIIFLIYIGAILVIFAYFAALEPNEQITLKYAFFIIPIALIIILIHKSRAIKRILTTSTPITYLFSYWNIPILILIALILFIAIVAVVKISINLKRPLRPYI